MGLRYVVLTSVDRDDLADGGAAHFAATVRAVRRALPGAGIEVLTPDFKGDREALLAVLEAEPEVFNHNIETVPRLFPRLRPQGRYRLSLDVLAAAKAMRPAQATKSGLMVGLGETDEEIGPVLADLRAVGVDIVTIGQYLRPTRDHEPVARYVTPAAFRAFEDEARTHRVPDRVLGRLRALVLQRGRGLPRRGARAERLAPGGPRRALGPAALPLLPEVRARGGRLGGARAAARGPAGHVGLARGAARLRDGSGLLRRPALLDGARRRPVRRPGAAGRHPRHGGALPRVLRLPRPLRVGDGAPRRRRSGRPGSSAPRSSGSGLEYARTHTFF